MDSSALFTDPNAVYFVPLGGSNEIGMNLNLYHYQGKWVMIDLGIGFADDHLPGVDVVVPNIDFITALRDDLVALVLTHAHEDHHGAVQYLWPELQCPVYATPFTASVLKAKLADMRNGMRVPIQQVEPGSSFKAGPFHIEMVPLTHSIPEMNALAIRTDIGTIFHTGDWKLDPTPLVGPESDENALTRLGKEGVLAMVCDSTNVFMEGESGSELSVREHLTRVVGECQQRVVVTTFASNIARLESIFHAAKANKRKVAMAGRALWRMTTAAKDAGYLQDMDEPLTDEQAMKEPRNSVLILTTGCQGEPRAALSRMARDDHPVLRLDEGDTVLFSSREIPGNEKRINWMHNQLVEKHVDIITSDNEPIHVSGHPARDELAHMYKLIKPRIAIPVHGERRHMKEHAKFAHSLQVPHSVVGHNGAVIRITKDDAELTGEVPHGYMCVEGSSIIPADGPVIRMRRKIRDRGIVFVTVILDIQNDLLDDPFVSAPGLLDEEEDGEWLDELTDAVAIAVESKGRKASRQEMENAIRQTIRKKMSKEFGKKPIIQVHMSKLAG